LDSEQNCPIDKFGIIGLCARITPRRDARTTAANFHPRGARALMSAMRPVLRSMLAQQSGPNYHSNCNGVGVLPIDFGLSRATS
jgi:hypothetical protein